MFLKKFIFVNWGNIPNLEFDMGPVNLFSGGNGSGKTTAADAIQTIMTAAHENLFQYNPGQDETTQRGRGGKRVRSQASYVLGCDDGSYARLDPTDGYLAAVFHPTQGETADPFTAVIAVRAWLDSSGNSPTARLDDSAFFIVPGEQLSLSQFVREDMTGRYVTPMDKLPGLLVAEYGSGAIEKYETKRGYLRRLYGALRGMSDGVSEQEAMSAARAFSRFMAYKPVQSINKFVADEILERKDLGEAVRSVSSQLKTIHAMERDAARLIESISTLEKASQHGLAYIERWVELHSLDYCLAQHAFLQRQQQYVDAKKQQDVFTQNIQDKEQEIELSQQRVQQVREQLIGLEAQRIGVKELQEKDELQARKTEQDEVLVARSTALLQQNDQLQKHALSGSVIDEALQSDELASLLPGLMANNARALCKKVTDQPQSGGINIQPLLQRDMTNDLSALEDHLDHARGLQKQHNQWWQFWYSHEHGGDKTLRDRLVSFVDEKQRQHRDLDEQFKRKTREVERLESHQVNYPNYVERALLVLRQQCPESEPRVLCDHIEVKDPRWQSAIEGYLGGARFSIIVEANYEAQAIRILRELPGRDNRARIIQGDKARKDAERTSIEHRSIVDVLEFSHATAMHYVTASYGTVLRVDDADELRGTRRGITSEGLGSGNYSMWRCDLPDAELVFGIAARERALTAKLDELEKLQVSREVAADKAKLIARVSKAVDAIQPVQYADAIADILAAHRSIQKLETLISQLDLGEFEALESQLIEARDDERGAAETEGCLRTEIGQLQQKLRSCDELCRKLSAEQEKNQIKVEQWEENLRMLATVWTDFDVDARLSVADEDARDLNVDISENQRDEVEKSLHGSERKLSDAIHSHNQHCRPGDAVIYEGFDGDYDSALFKVVCNVRKDIDRVYNSLKNNILVEKHSQLEQLKESFNSAFVTHLCHAIYQAINDGQRQVELLNKELQHHRFGADRETFRFDSHWIPEYRDYARFFEEVIKHPALGDEVTLFEADLTKKSRRVCDDMMSMLLDEDEQKAFRELERIADYRNYRRYEIYKEVEGKPPIALSEYGTGSGGQLETPAYIIRSAAITSAFRFAEGCNHLRMVLVDEAFSKMDETRSREVISYLTDTLGLQLVFIMPTSKCGPFMDLISNEFIYAKCPSETERGQLNTRVLVDRKQCNQDRIKGLWAKHRRTVYQQAELDFMALL